MHANADSGVVDSQEREENSVHNPTWGYKREAREFPSVQKQLGEERV